MLTFKVFVVWLHIVAVSIWVGGLFAVSFVAIPVLRGGIDSPAEAGRLAAKAIRRFQRISGEVMLLILLTGIFNLVNAGAARGFQFGGAYLALLAGKVTLFAAIAAIQGWQSLRLAPALASIGTGPGRTDHGEDSGARLLKRLVRRILIATALALVLAVSAMLAGLELGNR